MKKYFLRFLPLYISMTTILLGIVIFADKAVAVLAETRPVPRKTIIIIDPGHGGEDGGAVSCSGAYESAINLQIALRLNDLCHLLGFETRMIRTTDISIYTKGETLAVKKASDLKNRVEIVNGTENGILVSIHQNSFSDSQYCGAQVFYAHTSGSKELASCLQQQFHLMDPKNDRKIKSADHIYLMQHIQRRGVLVECGFLSNPQEEAKLRLDRYQKCLSAALATALLRDGST